jgi:hypothetical protein
MEPKGARSPGPVRVASGSCPGCVRVVSGLTTPGLPRPPERPVTAGGVEAAQD